MMIANNLTRKGSVKREKVNKPANVRYNNANQRLPKEEINMITNANSNITHWNVNLKNYNNKFCFNF